MKLPAITAKRIFVEISEATSVGILKGILEIIPRNRRKSSGEIPESI